MMPVMARNRRRTPRPGAALAAAVAAAGLALAAPAAAGAPPSSRPHPSRAHATSGGGQGAWTTYGGSPTRTSRAGGPSLRHLRRRWLAKGLGGSVYGEPLVWHDEVLVATESDAVVALGASNGKVLWRRSLGRPVPAGDLPCGDISPAVGITSTMVLDAARHEVYASAEVLESGAIHHVLVALDPAGGAIRWRRDLDRPGWDAAAQLQRVALALSKGRVVVGFGGNYGDCGDYHGHVMAVPATGKGPTRSYRVPATREGAIWAPSGVSVAANGDIFAATGNGSSTTSYDSGDSVLELTPTLRRIGSFAPAGWAADNAGDLDLGSSAPMLVPGGRVFIDGKESVAYLLDAHHLGGIGHPLASAPVCFSIGGDAYAGGLAYVSCPQGSLTAVRLGKASLSIAWRAPAGVNGSPTLAGGLCWVISGGHLVGLSPGSGKVLAGAPVIQTEHYAAPSAAQGLLVVAGDGAVEAFEGRSGYQP